MAVRHQSHSPVASTRTGVAVKVLVSGCGGVRTEEELVSGADQVVHAGYGDLEVLDRSGTVLARYWGGSWISWRRVG